MPTRGDVAESAVLAALIRQGLSVLVPFSHDSPYDLVVTAGDERFIRVQCKAGRFRDGCVIFNCHSTDHGRGPRDYVGRADVFGVYCPPLDRTFVVPVEEAGRRGTWLRVEPARNNQARGVRRADDYAAETWAAGLLQAAAA